MDYSLRDTSDGELGFLPVRNLRAVFADDVEYATANRAKAQQGYVKVFHISSYMRLCRLKSPALLLPLHLYQKEHPQAPF